MFAMFYASCLVKARSIYYLEQVLDRKKYTCSIHRDRLTMKLTLKLAVSTSVRFSWDTGW